LHTSLPEGRVPGRTPLNRAPISAIILSAQSTHVERASPLSPLLKTRDCVRRL
jgi:hypothetical protein